MCANVILINRPTSSTLSSRPPTSLMLSLSGPSSSPRLSMERMSRTSWPTSAPVVVPPLPPPPVVLPLVVRLLLRRRRRRRLRVWKSPFEDTGRWTWTKLMLTTIFSCYRSWRVRRGHGFRSFRLSGLKKINCFHLCWSLSAKKKYTFFSHSSNLPTYPPLSVLCTR